MGRLPTESQTIHVGALKIGGVANSSWQLGRARGLGPIFSHRARSDATPTFMESINDGYKITPAKSGLKVKMTKQRLNISLNAI